MATVLEVLVDSVASSAQSQTEGVAKPVAVLWPDPDRVWAAVVPALRESAPIVTLGTYDQDSRQGSAIWIRALLALPDARSRFAGLPAIAPGDPWIVYLPGVSRSDFAEPDKIDKALAPLAELVLRSVWWPSAASKSPWTPHSFLSSKRGVDLDIAGDVRTIQALSRAIIPLLGEDTDDLRRRGHLDAARLDQFLVADPARSLLAWMEEPEAERNSLSQDEWTAFIETCRATYSFDPAKGGALTALERLGARVGAWGRVWERFAERPRRYPNIVGHLDKARPTSGLFGDGDPHPDSWPSWNREQEDALRASLAQLLSSANPSEIRSALAGLATAHVPRIDTVWGQLGQAPLAVAGGHLAALVAAIDDCGDLVGVDSVAAWYAERGYRVDDFAVRALGAVTGADRTVVADVLHGTYDPWLDQQSRALQKDAANYRGEVGLQVTPGTCVMFVDALRYDLAHRLAQLLGSLAVDITPRLAAFPTVTPTGQPAVAPVNAGWGGGAGFNAADAAGRSVKGSVLRAALADASVQCLNWDEVEIGDPDGVAWTQTNSIDSLGHSHGSQLVAMLDDQLALIADHVRSLIDGGWNTVIVVTDHGFLLPAAPLPKVELPLAVTDGDSSRKPRVARLKAQTHAPEFPVVPWTWDDSVVMISAPGASAFEAGVTYTHGGLSPQECVIPVITVSAGRDVDALDVRIEDIRWTGQRCRIDFEPADAKIRAEIRSAAGDPATRIGDARAATEPGEVKILVSEDDASPGTGVFVVLLDDAGTVLAQQATTVGGDE